MSFKWPVSPVKISQGFGGNAAFYKQYGQKGHNGYDLAVPTGTKVYAADEGTVVFEGWGQNHSWMGSPAGICVLINHVGSHAGYAHLSRTVVNKGQKVKKGTLIGYSGATGTVTGPHLHFEMLPLKPNFKNGYAGRINPIPFIDTTKNATADQVKKAYRDILEREADPSGLKHYQNYPLSFVRADLKASAEYKKLQQKKAKTAADKKKLAEKHAKEEAAAKAVAETKAKQYEDLIRANRSLIEQIIEFLTRLLKISE